MASKELNPRAVRVLNSKLSLKYQSLEAITQVLAVNDIHPKSVDILQWKHVQDFLHWPRHPSNVCQNLTNIWTSEDQKC